MGEICSKIVDGDHNPPSAQSTPTKYLMVSSRNIANDKICNITDVRYLTEHDFYCAHNRTFVEKGDILFTSVASLGRTCIYNLEGPVTFQRSVTVIKTHIYNKYLKLFLDSPIYQNYVNDNARGTAQKGFYINQISDSWVPIPPLAEQIRIATKAEELINTVCQLEILKDDLGNNIEKAKSIILDMAIMGRLTPHDPFDEPAIELLKRISPNFSSCDNRHYENVPPGWAVCTLEDILDYEQPQKYIVSSTEYSDAYKIPVLTAGKSFIIGKTNENFGICERLPVIIFDDFTTDSKYVDFPFKVKSSAMKILRVKGNINPRYISYLMSITRLVGETHKRYWISEYRKIKIMLPPIEEQNRIITVIENIYNGLDNILAEL